MGFLVKKTIRFPHRNRICYALKIYSLSSSSKTGSGKLNTVWDVNKKDDPSVGLKLGSSNG